ncbi:enoyl-CoA hydratase-related protein [Hydrogenophaga sp.]|uniref:enoyl-CoA hydratase/isomerase family protein n=1 Tax=Hydrogenophaga sp. TaxID=1904254 RepID=UPI0026260BA4|nr:enoyl-CoA hydratase-related protein [Hydrogenophaga sp.]MCW5655615.1 enoyl-CoA hydratase/isomerase family protein [Hydrogenophaga sp.]
MTASTAVTVSVSAEGLATISLTQPQRGNPFDGTFVREMKEAFLQLWETPNLRAVLLRAEGANFSFGGDLKSFGPQLDQLPQLVRSWTADLHMGLQRAWQLPVPVVAEVQGWAMGGGVALLAGADIVLAGKSTRIGSAFSHIGFSCDSGSTVTLSARMGVARAKRFVMMGEVLSSQQAMESGLVDIVVEDAELSREALATAQRLAQGPTRAYGEIKRLFMRASAIPMEAMLEDEALTLARIAATHDAREGITSQLEKRKPVFKGH